MAPPAATAAPPFPATYRLLDYYRAHAYRALPRAAARAFRARRRAHATARYCLPTRRAVACFRLRTRRVSVILNVLYSRWSYRRVPLCLLIALPRTFALLVFSCRAPRARAHAACPLPTPRLHRLRAAIPSPRWCLAGMPRFPCTLPSRAADRRLLWTRGWRACAAPRALYCLLLPRHTPADHPYRRRAGAPPASRTGWVEHAFVPDACRPPCCAAKLPASFIRAHARLAHPTAGSALPHCQAPFGALPFGGVGGMG